MQRIFFKPIAALQGIVKHIEILDVPDVAKAQIGNRFIPDGYFEIGFNLGSEDLQFISSSNRDAVLNNPTGGYFYAQEISSSCMHAKGKLCIMIIKIYPWAAPLLSRMDFGELVNEKVNITYVLGKQARSLGEQILEVPSYSQKVALIQDFLLQQLYKVDEVINPILQHTTKLILHHNGKLNTRTIANQAHISERNLQRLFRKHYGISPKQLSKQIRLRHFATLLSKNRTATFTDIALQCGYYDQAHFNHEFKSIVKVTPRAYFLKETPLISDFLEAG